MSTLLKLGRNKLNFVNKQSLSFYFASRKFSASSKDMTKAAVVSSTVGSQSNEILSCVSASARVQ